LVSSTTSGKQPPPEKFKLLRVTLQQKPQDQFVRDFISKFRAADLGKFRHGDDWP
jgi:hypothetical protein